MWSPDTTAAQVKAHYGSSGCGSATCLLCGPFGAALAAVGQQGALGAAQQPPAASEQAEELAAAHNAAVVATVKAEEVKWSSARVVAKVKKEKRLLTMVKAELRHEVDVADQAVRCVVCLEADRNTVVFPCAHYGFCSSCAPSVGATCHICRRRVHEAVVLYRA